MTSERMLKEKLPVEGRPEVNFPTVEIRFIRGVAKEFDPLRLNGEPHIYFVGVGREGKGLTFYELDNKAKDYVKGPFFDNGGFFVNNNKGKWKQFKPTLGELMKYISSTSIWPMKSVGQYFKDVTQDFLLSKNPKENEG